MNQNNPNTTPNGTTNHLGLDAREYSELQTEKAFAKFNNPKRVDRRDDKGGRNGTSD